MGDTDTGGDENDPGNYYLVSDIKELVENEGLKEIGLQAIWSVSSCKQGYGVSLLRDNNLDTYWQSDGSQPHMVNIQFRRKTTLHSIGIYMDHKTDESYTPNKLSVRVGNDFNDLHEIETLEINEPSGWVLIRLNDSVHGRATRTFMTQIAVLQNHQNGRDTHLRQIKIFASSKDGTSIDNVISGRRLPQFTSVDVAMYSIR